MKKYKLFASTTLDQGEKAPCAFFASPDGCRNGDKCKFAHTLPVSSPPDTPNRILEGSESVVSSESSLGEREGHKSPAPGPSKKRINPPVDVPPNRQDTDLSEPKKKKARRSKKAAENSPFANPKEKSQAKQEPPSDAQKSSSPLPVVGKTAANNKAAAKLKNKPTQSQKAKPQEPPTFDPSKLNLPIACFSVLPGNSKTKEEPPSPKNKEKKSESTTPLAEKEHSKPLPVHSSATKWIPAIEHTYRHARYETNFDFERFRKQDEETGLGNIWIRSRPYGSWCENFPQVIAIDCEMCETEDPVSGKRDSKALCRISVVNAGNGETLLDTLVKPAWPVRDYRTWINGIAKEHLENVEFTLRHAQAFMMSLCSDKTVIVGHAVHNDLQAIHMEHCCVVDTAFLLEAKDRPNSSVSLKDGANALLDITMPSTHDSVYDALISLQLAELWVKKDGKVDKVERTSRRDSNISQRESSGFGKKLFVHRIPANVTKEHLLDLFVSQCDIHPVEVEDLAEVNKDAFKAHVVFRSPEHARLAFDTLSTQVEMEASGRCQKKVYLRNGGYIRVRENVKRVLDQKQSTVSD